MAELAFDLEPVEIDRIEQAEAAVRSYCGWHIAPSRTETVTLQGNSASVLMLPSLYVTSVTSVSVNGTPLAVGDFTVHQAGYLTRSNLGYWAADDVVVVVFTHGYVDPPADVVGVVQGLAQRVINNPKALKSWTRGPFSETYETGAAGDKAILDAYRIVTVA